MKILWLTTTHMGMESIMGSLKRILYLNVSSMNQEPAVTGLTRFAKSCDDIPEFQWYHYDQGKEAQYHYDGEVDHNILRKVKAFRPEIIIYSGPANGKCRPQIDTLLNLRNEATTIGYFLDGGCPEWHPVLEEYKLKNVFDLTVNTDGNPHWPKRDHDITLWQPVDETFYDERLPKDITLGFSGGAGSRHRQEAIHSLKERAGLVLAERFEQWGTYIKFSEFMLRCKITVNFPETGSGKSYHLKNRVIEAGFARCCLFEKRNPVTPLYFKPGIDYIEYDTIDDLIEKLPRTPQQFEIAEKFGEQLHRTAMERYTAHKFWKRVFDAIPRGN